MKAVRNLRMYIHKMTAVGERCLNTRKPFAAYLKRRASVIMKKKFTIASYFLTHVFASSKKTAQCYLSTCVWKKKEKSFVLLKVPKTKSKKQ